MYMFIVTTILISLGVLAYYLFIKHKGEKLTKIERGLCPECGEKSIRIKRVKSGGCSGTSSVVYKCDACGYEEEFNVQGAGGCSL